MSEELAERLARRFHELYEDLAPDFGYQTRKESAVPWEQVPPSNHDLMVAVARTIVDEFGLMASADRLVVYRDGKGEWRWQRKAPNNRIVAVSGEGFVRREYAAQSAQRSNSDIPSTAIGYDA